MFHSYISKVLICLFLIYILNAIYAIYSIFLPPECSDGSVCIPYYLNGAPKLQLAVFLSVNSVPLRNSDVTFVGRISSLDWETSQEKLLNLSLPFETQKNGTLFMHLFLLPQVTKIKLWNDASSFPDSVYIKIPLTEYAVPTASTYQLLVGEKADKSINQTVTHLKSEIGVRILTDISHLPTYNIPGEIYPYFRLSKNGKILPIMVHDSLNDRASNLVDITNKQYEQLSLKISPINIGKLRLMLIFEAKFHSIQSYGFSKKDIDEVKGIIINTNLYLLCVTIFVASIHLLLDVLALKNEVIFWKNRETMVGLSSRVVLWHAFSSVVVLLYLIDEDTSVLVWGPSLASTVIEFWKIQKVFQLDWKKLKLKPKVLTAEEESTMNYDAQGMVYLSYILYPLCVGGALYSLVYVQHKSWYSWCIHSMVNCVYSFGFLFMLPQLFINYKLKSVANLPWRAFMYKAFNTFIDDLFAFIITMPISHRLACFRDDVVFLIYLYQRWLYPVDSKRTDETVGALGVSSKKEKTT